MVRILTVCTGNVCRSPLAEALLRSRLAGLDVEIASAGVRALVGEPMTQETAHLAEANGVPTADADAHRAQLLTEPSLERADLVLAMAREHRRHAVELVPARLRSTFTVRELGRLAQTVTDPEIAEEVGGETDPRRRLKIALTLVASQRYEIEPPADPAEDDVADPYRRSWEAYERSVAQLLPAVDQVARVVRAALQSAPALR